mmetsp:Transcript_234/g.434  ORF Transcript_234/g.434 Transcript_234/m.434 type:complete len:315 (+) Transcript_234:737-1681(+)
MPTATVRASTTTRFGSVSLDSASVARPQMFVMTALALASRSRVCRIMLTITTSTCTSSLSTTWLVITTAWLRVAAGLRVPNPLPRLWERVKRHARPMHTAMVSSSMPTPSTRIPSAGCSRDISERVTSSQFELSRGADTKMQCAISRLRISKMDVQTTMESRAISSRTWATGTCISAPLRAMPAYPLVLRSATVHVMHASASTCLRTEMQDTVTCTNKSEPSTGPSATGGPKPLSNANSQLTMPTIKVSAGSISPTTARRKASGYAAIRRFVQPDEAASLSEEDRHKRTPGAPSWTTKLQTTFGVGTLGLSARS